VKISIITVVYNNKHTIINAIESVLSQTYKNIEYIVIDGASNDGTVELLNLYATKINIIVSEPDLGIYDAMNKGISIATGDVIGILNSDDVYANEFVLQKIFESFQLNNTAEVLYGNLVYVKKNDINKIVRTWISIPYYSNFFEDGNVPPHPSFFVKKSIYNKIGFFDINYKLAADYEMMFRILKVYNFESFYLNELIVKMRLGGASNNNYLNIMKGNIEIVKAWKDNGFRMSILTPFYKVIKRVMQFMPLIF
jgi:glycosyltransferase